MAQVFYVHWNKDEASATVKGLRAAGHTVSAHHDSGAEAWKLLRESPPDVMVVSLARLPSHGRRMAEATKEFRTLRELPVIFVDGDPEKVAQAKMDFPDAGFCKATNLVATLKKPLPKARPATRKPTRTGYSGTPLVNKLGIKAGHRVALVNAPKGYERTLGSLPDGVELQAGLAGKKDLDVIQLFTKNQADLKKMFPAAAKRLASNGGLWVSWPKKASGVPTDVDEAVARKIGLDCGLVDNKICAVDETWSGLRFVIRVKDRL